jgi:hypothetical protein
MSRSGFAVQLSRRAEKDLDKLASRNHLAHRAAVKALGKLESDAEAGHLLSGTLHPCRALEFSVQGSGAWRAIYVALEADGVCVVFLIAPHENVYREAEARWAALRRDLESD